MLILFITASAFLVLLPVESRAARHTEELAQASLATDAGINEGLIWLRYQLQPKDGSASKEPMQAGVYPSEADRTRNLGNGWAYRWELVADAETFPNGSNPIRAYTIVSKAFRNGRIKREARAEVLQDSLSKYAALYDNWPSNLVKPLRSTSAPAGGPVHVNDILRMWIPEGNAFWNSAGTPHYDYGVTAVDTGNANNSSQDGFLYYQGNWNGSNSAKRPYNNSGPIESRYSRMAVGGRDAMNSAAGHVQLPENTFSVKDAAFGFGQSNYPPANQPGVYLNEVDGVVQGIYIEGDVEEMQLGLGGSEPSDGGAVNYGDNSWVKIELPINGQNKIDNNENFTVITVKDNPVTLPPGTVVDGSAIGGSQTVPVGSTLMRRPDGSYNVHSGDLNGVVYATGDINNVWGVNKGRRTIAVEGDVNNNIKHKIRIGGREDDSPNSSNSPLSLAAGEKGLIQHGSVDADNDGVLDPPTNADNVLGIIGRDVMVSRRLKNSGRWDNAHTQNNPLYLYAIVLGGLTGDGGTYAVEDYNSGGGGYAYRYGSRIMVDAGAWGTTSGHGLVNGNTFYDEPASNSPPPYFPSQPTFTLRSYFEQPALTGETL